MNYLKKNIPLLCFVAVTIIAALGITVISVQTLLNMKTTEAQLKQYMQEIDDNSKKKPSYHQDNLKALQSDAAELRKKLFEVQCRYGKIHRKALNTFAMEIGTTESVLLQQFKDFYGKLPDDKKADTSGGKDKEIFDNFIKSFYTTEKEVDGKKQEEVDAKKKEMVDQACENFFKYTRTEYTEYRKVQKKEYRCLLEALGLPVTDVLGDLRTILEDNDEDWGALIPGYTDMIENAKDTKDADKNRKAFLVSHDGLNINQLYLAYRQIQIKQDVYKRMTAAKISSVGKFDLKSAAKTEDQPGKNNAEKTHPLDGVKKGSYVYYTYEIEVTGSMASLRDFLNGLSDAYKDNRIYNVRELSLVREVEGEMPEKIMNAFKENVTAVSNDGKISNNYGMTLIGRDPSVKCIMVIDYIIYADDMIQRKQIETAQQ